MEYQVQAVLPKGLDVFTRGYLECAEWCGLDDGDQREAFELAVTPTWNVDSLKQAMQDCAEFQHDNHDALNRYYAERSESDAGHDFWLTRNRHGAGFWDGRVSDADVAERLTDASHVYGEAYVWFDEDKGTLSLS